MNNHFRIVKGVGIECGGKTQTPPSHWSDADLNLAIGWAELAFAAGERKQLIEQLHKLKVTPQKLDAIVPMIVADLHGHTDTPISIA